MRFSNHKTVVLMLGTFLVPGTAPSPAGADEPQPSEEPAPTNLARTAVEMQKEVEALRGWNFKHPVDVDVYTEEQMRDFIRGPLEEAGEEEKRAHGELGMKMIGLMPRDADLKTVTEEMFNNVAPPGIYNHHTKELRVLKRADGDYGSFSVCVTLVHELTHALDDQHFDLAKMEKTGGDTSDIGNAWGAVVEGSAVTVQERFKDEAKRSGKFDQAEFQENMRKGMEQMQAMTKAPPYLATFFARFPSGVRFLQRGSRALQQGEGKGATSPFELQGIADAMRTAATSLPRSSEQILHPEKYWKAEQRDEPVVVNDEGVERLVETTGFRVIARDTLGELLCAVVTSPADKKINPMAMPMPGYWTNGAATGWGGDRFFLLTSASNEGGPLPPFEDCCGLWFTVWDTPADRDEFIEGYETHRDLPARALVKLGDLGAVYLLGFDEARREAVEKTLRTTPPPLMREGKPWSWAARPAAERGTAGRPRGT